MIKSVCFNLENIKNLVALNKFQTYRYDDDKR